MRNGTRLTWRNLVVLGMAAVFTSAGLQAAQAAQPILVRGERPPAEFLKHYKADGLGHNDAGGGTGNSCGKKVGGIPHCMGY